MNNEEEMSWTLHQWPISEENNVLSGKLCCFWPDCSVIVIHVAVKSVTSQWSREGQRSHNSMEHILSIFYYAGCIIWGTVSKHVSCNKVIICQCCACSTALKCQKINCSVLIMWINESHSLCCCIYLQSAGGFKSNMGWAFNIYIYVN